MKELYTAMCKAQASIKGALKENTNPHFKSRYADLESVIEAIRQPLHDNGLCFFQSVADGYISTVICHTSGEQCVSTLPFVHNAQDMQKLSAALTYARRQSLCTAFGVPQVDDDGEACAGRPAAPVSKTVQKSNQMYSGEKIPAGLLTDKGYEDEEPKTPAVKFQAGPVATPKTDMTVKELQRLGLEAEVRDVYPLFVDGRDNELVKRIVKEEKLDPKGIVLKSKGDALKKYLSESNAASLHDAIVNFFMENKV